MEEPLTQLKDIHLPDPISWWPLAPGTWVAILAGILLLAWLTRYLMNKYRATRYRRLALAELHRTQPDAQDQVVFVQQLNELLKRTALIRYPRPSIASLTGKAWLEFLDQTSRSTAFTLGVGRALAEIPYRRQADTEVDCQALWKLCKKWILEHQ